MSNLLAKKTNRNDLYFNDFEEYPKTTTYSYHEDKHAERRRKEKEIMHRWDIFKQFPERPKNGSMVDKKSYEVLLKFVKTCVYLLLFIIILCFSVISKGTILFATSNINSRNVPFCDYDLGLHLSKDTELLTDLPEAGRIAWIWCIIIAFSVPEFLGMLNAIRVCLFKNIRVKDLPSVPNFLFSILIEVLHSVGMALLFFICLPDLNVVQGASVMSCVCFIPSLLAFVGSSTKYLRSPGSKNCISVLLDALAFVLQTTGIFASFFFKHRERSESKYVLPVALVLSSIRWWPNYVSTNEKQETWLEKIKKNFEPSRFFIQEVTAIVRISVFITSAVLIVYFKGITLDHFLRGFWIKDYVVPIIAFSPTTNLSTVESTLNQNSYVQINILLIHVFSSFFAYTCGKFACKTLMHRFGFALPLMLTAPTTTGLLIFFYHLRDQNTCAFHGVIPDYLFFDVPILKPFEAILSQWYVWFSILLWISQIWITSHTWTSTCETLARSEGIFAISTYDSLVIDQCLSLNRRKKSGSEEDTPLKKDNNIEGNSRSTIIKVCATMWHEIDEEMNKLIGSILRLDKDNCAMRVIQDHYDVRIPDYYDLETHIFFDDAFQCVHKCEGPCINENETQVDEYVIKFVKVLEQNLTKMRMRARPPEKYPTPFGGRLKWTLPGGSNLIVHLKDKNKIRHNKRWSHVMYMYYLLGYNIMELPINVERKEKIAENTFILSLNENTDFHPNAVKTLIDLMKRDQNLGAACGRIHPIGSGPVAWFQKFEYAIDHWFLKSTEHTIGCVLYTPGYFSLFRAKALMDYNVMRKYATESTEARHYIQYDRGEDRWLCNLILQMGYRIEYSAASDAYTHVPENFDEFYDQRRRWIPSSIANIFDFLSTSEETRRYNKDISWLYIFYQWILMGSAIIAPGMIFLMLVGAFVATFQIDNWTSLVYNFIPILTFIIVCLNCKEPLQLKIAAIISVIYGLIMGVVLIGIMLQITEDGMLAPNTLLFFIIVGQMIIAGLLHPREWSCLFCGIIYFLTIPSVHMFLMIFAIFNLHDISWGTRNSKSPDASKPETKGKCMLCGHKKGFKEVKLNKLFDMVSKIEEKLDAIGRNAADTSPSVLKCMNSFYNKKEDINLSTFYKSEKDSAVDFTSEQDTMLSDGKGSTIYKSHYKSDYKLEDSDYSDNDIIHELPIYSGSIRNEIDFVVNPSWLFDTELGKGGVSYLVTEEETFWIDVIDAYLKPIPVEEKNEKVAKDLMKLRNKCLLQFLIVNAIFVIMVFLMQVNKDRMHLEWPLGATYNITYDFNNREVIHIEKHYLRLEPIGMVFIVTFVSILFIQFLSMLVHRFETFCHLLAKTSLDWYCCNKTKLPDEAVVVRYRDIFSKYVQKAYDKMIQDGKKKTRKSPGSRKPLPDLIECREPFIMESFESLFHEYLDKTDLAEISGKFKKPVTDAVERRSTVHRTQQRNIEDRPISESANNFRKNTPRGEPYTRESGYDNFCFDSD